ncbi:MAG: hypothetical protein FDZ72_10770 [Betaproteobacteria bacterium]|nr:MAG: hypothetical protein FDZ72_10770 [Betaproteobacteria bacterium]
MSGNASLLAISLDVVDSTKIKSSLADFSGMHGTSLDKLYSEFAKMMLISMNRFIELVDLDAVLDIKRLFLVKRIGDEYWYVYELNGLEQHDRTRHSTHMLMAIMAFFSKSPYEVVATNPEEPDDPNVWDTEFDAMMRKPICWKATIDHLSHAMDLAGSADDKLDELLAGLTAHGKKWGFTTNGDNELLELKNRLGVGFGYAAGQKAIYAMRSDYIGIEVDRFFRMSKFSVKGKILAGRELLASLMMEEASPGKYMFRDPLSGGSFTTANNGAYVEHKIFSEREIKGIKGGYAGAYIFDEYSSALTSGCSSS